MAHSSRQELSRKHSDDGAYLCCSAEHPDTKTDSIISITAHKKSQRSLLVHFLCCLLLVAISRCVYCQHYTVQMHFVEIKHTASCLFVFMLTYNFFFSVFAVIENGTEDFDQADIKTDSFQVRNLLFFRFFSLSL